MPTETIRFIIPVKPVGKARPRFTRRANGKGIRSYNAQVTEEGEILLHCMAIWGDRPPITGAFMISGEFVFARPKSHFGTGRNSGKLKPSAPAHHTSKPDVDNILKIILDALQGVIFADDSQCVSVDCRKRYATFEEYNRSMVVLEITPLEERK